MTDAITKLSPPDLGRLAAEVLGYEWIPAFIAWQRPDGTRLSRSLWHPTQSHDQCQLLIDEIEKRGLVQFYIDELLGLDPSPPNATTQGVRAMSRAFQWLATATPLEKTQAAVAVLRKGE